MVDQQPRSPVTRQVSTVHVHAGPTIGSLDPQLLSVNRSEGKRRTVVINGKTQIECSPALGIRPDRNMYRELCAGDIDRIDVTALIFAIGSQTLVHIGAGLGTYRRNC